MLCMNQYEFASRIAVHQRQAITSGLMELGFPDSRGSSMSTPVETYIDPSSVAQSPRETHERRIYQVQFKHNFRYCTSSCGPLATGDFVILDCTYDQEDLGVISNYLTEEQFRANRAKLGKSPDDAESKISQIIRIASPEERSRLPVKHEQEQRLLRICQHLAVNVHQLPMNIYGVEFQFDGKKVSVFYTSDIKVDYSVLVREIYDYCKIHIWMRKTNLNVKFAPKQFAINALITGIAPF